MKNILVDQTGELRCPKCKGRNFDLARTAKAKVGGWFALGVGVMLMPKRMKCLTCGKTSKGGDAKKWTDKKLTGVIPVAIAPQPVQAIPAPPKAVASPLFRR